MSAAEELNPRYTAAMQFAMRGLRLLPVEHHTRAAILPKWEQNAANDLAFVDHHFASGYNNIGLCCGPQPAGWNILCVDIDDPDAWAELEAEHGKVDRDTLCWHRSPTGGKHLFFDVPPGMAITRQNFPVKGIDLRGGHEGNVGCGYVLLPTSEAPNKLTGELLAYGASPGRGLLDRNPGPAPGWLLAEIEYHLRPPERQQPVATAATHQGLDGDDPWSWVRANVHWADKLNQHGWTQKGDKWTRPGKTVREGTSSFLHDDGRFTFWSQTDLPAGMMALGHLNVDGSYSISLADFITAYEFDGDRQRFGREYRLHVMPPPPQRADGSTTGADPESSEDAIGGSWSTPMDLTTVLDGTMTRPMPTVLRRTDGVAMFYPGVINGIHGEPGIGKGWVALSAVAEQIGLGETVIYIDMEDTPQSIVSRLRTIGVTSGQIAQHLLYIRPVDPTSTAETAALVALVKERRPTLVIIDSLGEAFGLDSINENNDSEVAPWLRWVPRLVADAGPCVVIVDHVTKALDNPLYPKGSGRKLGAVGGAQFYVEALKPLMTGQGGKLRLTCAKDRNGSHTRSQVSAEMVFNASGPEDMIVRIFPVGPAAAKVSPQERHDEATAECAVAMLTVAKRRRKPFTKTELILATGGYSATIKGAAANLLIQQGAVTAVDAKHFKVTT